MNLIGSYATGIFPRPKKLINTTRAHGRREIDDRELDKAFEEASCQVINAQISVGFSHVTDGMLRWQDLFRPIIKGLGGVEVGSLARWFNNNTFYRRPIIVNDLQWKKRTVEETAYMQYLPKKILWKAILPAPYTFIQLSENKFYKDQTDFMFKYAQALREQIEHLARLNFRYVQLSDPALVYGPTSMSMSTEGLSSISEALRFAVEGISIKTCLQTFFGDFSKILPEALDFPVDHLGIDLSETDLENLREYSFGKGVALGLVDSRSSLVEKPDELTSMAEEIIESIYPSGIFEVFICPNCDLEFLPWERARRKMNVSVQVAERLREEFS